MIWYGTICHNGMNCTEQKFKRNCILFDFCSGKSSTISSNFYYKVSLTVLCGITLRILKICSCWNNPWSQGPLSREAGLCKICPVVWGHVGAADVLKFGTRWRGVVNLTRRSLYCRGESVWSPCTTHWVESYVRTNAGLEILGKRENSNPSLESNYGLSRPSSELHTAVGFMLFSI